MAKGGGGFTGKPAKGTMRGRDYGKAVSTAAKAMGATKKTAGMAHKPMMDMPAKMPMAPKKRMR